MVATSLGLTGNLKHMERRHAWLQHMVRRGKFMLEYISTTEQLADFLTKALHFPAFNRCSVCIGKVCLADVGVGDDDVQQLVPCPRGRLGNLLGEFRGGTQTSLSGGYGAGEATSIVATALGASESLAALGANMSAATGASDSTTSESIASAEALHTLTLDCGASRCYFRNCTTATPLAAPVPVSLADPSRAPIVARASTVLPCPAVPSGSLSGLHLPSFSTNLVIRSGENLK
ncbi:unnamed protein product [Closterium sp. NIES-53]